MSLLQIITICLLLDLMIADCPLSLYPRFTTIGHIHAQIGRDPQQHDKGLIYQYPLSESIHIDNQQNSQQSNNCLVSVNGLGLVRKQQYQEIGYNIKVIDPKPDYYYGKKILTSVSFEVTVKSTADKYSNNRQYKWNYIQFNFLHSQNPQLYLGTVSSSDAKPSNFAYAYKISKNLPSPARSNFNVNRISARIFVSGISLKQQAYKPSDYVFDVEGTIKQLQQLKKYSWNIQLINKFTKVLKDQKTPSLQINDIQVYQQNQGNNFILSFGIQTSSSVKLLDFSYSFLLYLEKSETTSSRNIYQTIMGNFWAVNNEAHYYQGIDNNGMMIIGFSGFKYNYDVQEIGSQFALSLTYGKEDFYQANGTSKRYFIHSQTKNQRSQFLISYFAIQVLAGFICQDCIASPFIYEQYCVSQCPSGYVQGLDKNGARQCMNCDVTNYLVPNSQKQSCVCASNYYFVAPTSKCEQCPSDCLTCSGNKCLTCDSSLSLTNRILNPYTNRCQCPVIGSNGVSYYDNMKNHQIICQKCHQKCKTCSGPLMNQCLSCPLQRQLFGGYCSCPRNFKQNASGQCKCLKPYELSYYGKCEINNQLCPAGQQYRGGYTRTCECLSNFFRNIITGFCMQMCPPNQQFSYELNKCVCLASLVYNNITRSCQACSARPFQHYNPVKKQCECLNSEYNLNELTQECVRCPIKSYYDFKQRSCKCIFNFYMMNGNCIKCQSKYEGENCFIGAVEQQFTQNISGNYNYNGLTGNNYGIPSNNNNNKGYYQSTANNNKNLRIIY